MISTAASGLNPVIIIVKTMKTDAIEFLDAKNPFVVENRPVNARAIEARPTIGDRKIDSTLPLQEKNGKNPSRIFARKVPQLKLSTKVSWTKVDGYLMSSYPIKPIILSTTRVAKINGILGRDLIIKRKCGCTKA